MSLTKQKFTQILHENIGVTESKSRKIVDLFFDTIKDSLVSGDEVKISGFGSFTLRDKVERPGRNPKTKEDVIISARKVVTFKSGNKLKECISKD